MTLFYDIAHSHRWFLNFQKWKALYESDQQVGEIVYQNNLAPDLSALKSAFMYYSAQRDSYLLHMQLLSVALGVAPAAWDADVTSVARPIMQEFIVDVVTLLPSAGIKLRPISTDVEAFLESPFEHGWVSMLHTLERKVATSPQDNDTFVDWLNACLQAKLAEQIQSIRRAALGYWASTHLVGGKVAVLRNLVGVNIEAFGWRFSDFINRTVVPEKIDPRNGSRLSWPATKTDHHTVESHPMFGRKIAENPLKNLPRLLGILRNTVVLNRPVKAFRRFYTCPRRDIFDKVGKQFPLEDQLAEESMQRVFCKFCFMHAYTEALRNIPAFFFVRKFEHIPYHGTKSQCVFLWEFKLLPLGLIGLAGDWERKEYVDQITQTPPPILGLESLSADIQIAAMRNSWDRHWIRA
jgi:hypothetical protein